MTFFTLVGFFGVFLYLGSYFLLSLKKMDGNGFSYLYMNLFGAIFVLISLIENFNAPSLLIQSSWILLSIYGLIYLKFFSKDNEDKILEKERNEYLRLKKKFENEKIKEEN